MTLSDFLDFVHHSGYSTFAIENAFSKAWSKIHGDKREDGSRFTLYKKIYVGISGGSDSDIMLDMIERIGHPVSEVHYAFYDTGMEFQATKRHLDYLEQRYGITIHRYRAKTSVPIGVKKGGVPFLNKKVAQYIHRLQSHGFQFEDGSVAELMEKYPNCESAIRWWCNDYGEKSMINISRIRGLKEFMMENPPAFHISDNCCYGAKKATAHMIQKEVKPNLECVGIRRAEGGARSYAVKSCFDDNGMYGVSVLRPVFWFTQDDKTKYEQLFGIKHSDCYSVYGLTRTGCACCPFGRNFEAELESARKYEPNLYKAANHVFGQSYDYARKFHEFRESMK